MFLFVAVVVTMASYYPKASLNGEYGRNLTYATLLAQSQAEEIKTATFGYVTPGNFSGPLTFTQAGVTFTRTVAITPCAVNTAPPCPNPIDTTTSPNLTVVAVTVAWQEPSTTSQKTVTLTTVIQNFF